MKVLLLAATGRAGRTILNELIRRGHQVTAVARNLDKLPEQLPETVKRVRDDLSSVERSQRSSPGRMPSSAPMVHRATILASPPKATPIN
jgi:nucleoside-diphosphate-sugar epimerase